MKHVVCGILLLSTGLLGSAQAAIDSQNYLAALKVADFILSLQDANGAIRDEPEGGVVNEDSNMEYALIGLAAAYDQSRTPKYLIGLEKGIQWLAERENMSRTKWRGSWFYTYASKPPYAHKAMSPGGSVKDVRGVDATSTLFVYLLYLHSRLSGSDLLVQKYQRNARSALNFVLNHNWSRDGFSFSSWQLNRRGVWKQWRYEYSADQGDVYLGMNAGAILYDEPTHRYKRAASSLKMNVNRTFFLSQMDRYGVGRDDMSVPDYEMAEFDDIFPQGYVPWVFGLNDENLRAYHWMEKHVQSNGSLKFFDGDPGFCLSAAIFAMAAQALDEPPPTNSLNWLVRGVDPLSGGIHDTADIMDSEYTNVAGFAVLALLHEPAWK